MKAIAQMTLGELAAYICSHLDSRGIHGFRSPLPLVGEG